MPARDNILQINIDEVVIPERRRPVDPETLSDLVKSIKKIGLQHPITVRSVDGKLVLVAGRHRLEAVRSLGLEDIRAVVAKWDEVTARLWEISENLHRKDLDKQEEADQVAEWVKLTSQSEDHEKPGQLVQVSGGRGLKGGIADAARELPIPGSSDEAKRKYVERSIKIAAIDPEAKEAAAEAGLSNNQSALLQIARTPKDEQVAKVDEIAERKEARPRKTKKPKPAEKEFSESSARFLASMLIEHPPGQWSMIRDCLQTSNTETILSIFKALEKANYRKLAACS